METRDPRVTRTVDAVVRAVRQVLVTDGPGAVTHQRVAEVAGVGRATLYRHWPSVDDLLYEGLAPPAHLVVPIGDEPLRDYLVAFVLRVAAQMSEPEASVVLATMLQLARFDERARVLREQVYDATVQELSRAVKLARRRGEAVGTITPAQLNERLVGPVLFRVLMLGRTFDRKAAEAIVDATLSPTVR